MLILIGTVPTAYALNHALTPQDSIDFVAVSQQAANALDKYVDSNSVIADPHDEIKEYVRTKEFTPNTMLALRNLINDLGTETSNFHELGEPPEPGPQLPQRSLSGRRGAAPGAQVGQALRGATRTSSRTTRSTSTERPASSPCGSRWPSRSGAGLGTMVGWKRIVITVGEKIGKDHLTYAQGAAAEITAMVTIWAADMLVCPVSTTHVLSSGVAGTMAANTSGLQMVDRAQLADGVGAHPAGLHSPVRRRSSSSSTPLWRRRDSRFASSREMALQAPSGAVVCYTWDASTFLPEIPPVPRAGRVAEVVKLADTPS